jgi:spectinomycin phosphotransferase
MKTEPTLDKSRLAELLTCAYGIVVVELAFVPTGWVSACYRVTCNDGTRRFLKLQPLLGPPVTAASSPAFYLPLTHQLYARGHLPAIAYPLATREGQLWTTWEGWRVILHNHIDGQVVGHDGMTDAIVSQLAGLVGRLHRSLPVLDLEVRFFESFEFAFHAEVVAVLAKLGNTGLGKRVGWQGLQDLLLPNRRDVLQALGLLQALGDRAKAAAHPVVVCHTDLHGENLMWDDAGRLYIVDWEGAVLAPREQDLFMFVDHHRFREIFVPAYEAETGPLRLDPDLLAFYMLRRVVEDMTDWILRLASGEQSEEQDAADLHELEETLDALRDFLA